MMHRFDRFIDIDVEGSPPRHVFALLGAVLFFSGLVPACGGSVAPGEPVSPDAPGVDSGLPDVGADGLGDSISSADSADAALDGDVAPCGPTPAGDSVRLASASNPEAMAVSEGFVYWTETLAGKVMKVPVEGGCPIVVAEDLAVPRQVTALPTGGVVWITYGSTPSANDGDVTVADASGHHILVGHQSAPQGVAVSPSGTIVWSTWPTEGKPSVWRWDSGSIPVSNDGAQYLASSDTSIFFSDAAVIKTALLGGGGTSTFSPDQVGSRFVVLHGASVYWTDDDSGIDPDGNILRQDIGGGVPVKVVPGIHTPNDLRVDDTGIYWTTRARLFRSTEKGGTVALTDLKAVRLALDGTFVYWGGPSGIYRRRK